MQLNKIQTLMFDGCVYCCMQLNKNQTLMCDGCVYCCMQLNKNQTLCVMVVCVLLYAIK